MCPLERAKTDSDWAKISRSSRVSRMCHGSTGYARSRIMASSIRLGEKFVEIADDDIRAVSVQVFALSHPVDTDHVPEPAGAPGGDPGECVLEHRRLPRLDPQRARRRQ